MDIESIPLFAMLKGKMGYLNQRQQVIAQNVANASTPGFVPQDLKPFTASKTGAGGGKLALAQPQPAAGGGDSGGARIALKGQDNSSAFAPVRAPDDEAQLDGNQVVLEQEMTKMNTTRSDYDIAVGIYQKAMGFLQMAAQEPGKG
ncbi:MAG TPA: flagellar basal body protein [Caulobacteraceae bacterium]|nr:flagellar basal body protein [Caulobacteraceae bacterium]